MKTLADTKRGDIILNGPNRVYLVIDEFFTERELIFLGYINEDTNELHCIDMITKPFKWINSNECTIIKLIVSKVD